MRPSSDINWSYYSNAIMIFEFKNMKNASLFLLLTLTLCACQNQSTNEIDSYIGFKINKTDVGTFLINQMRYLVSER